MREFTIHRIARSRSGVVGRVDTMYLSLPRSSLFIPPLPTFRTYSEERGGGGPERALQKARMERGKQKVPLRQLLLLDGIQLSDSLD